MLNKPSLRELLPRVDSKYTLVILAAKRARSLIDNNPDLVDVATFNSVSVALREIADGKLTWTMDVPNKDAN